VKKAVLVVLLVLGMMFVLAGCGVTEFYIVLNDDLSGRFEVVDLIDSEVAEEGVESREASDYSQLKLISEENIQREENGVTMVGTKKVYEFESFPQIQNIQFTVKEENGIVELTGIDASDPEKAQQKKSMSDMLRESGYKASLRMKVPGKILETNAKEHKDGELYWDLLDESFLADGRLWIKYEKGASAVVKEEPTPSDQVEEYDLEKLALELNAAGILKGSDKGFELEKELTRVEGTLIYARLLGLDEEIAAFVNDTTIGYVMPFKDVPDWAKNEIGYLNYKELAKGVASDMFGSTDKMSDQQFATLLLRGAGYSDAKGDFVWNQAMDKAVEVGMITEDDKSFIQKESSFTRGEMALLAYKFLQFK